MKKQHIEGMLGAKVLLVDDHKLLLETVAALFEQAGVDEIFTATSTDEALSILQSYQPDLVVSDIAMPGDGLQLAKQVRRYFPDVKILLLTMHAEADFIEKAIDSGVHGFINKTSSAQSLLRAASMLLEGESVFPATQLQQRYQRGLQAAPAEAPALTQREEEILACLGAGYANKEIARALNMAEGTVKVHIKTILKKLAVRNRTQAALYAYEHGYNPALTGA